MSIQNLILSCCAILLAVLTRAQSVVVSNYFNSIDQRDEWIELLVTGDDVDIRNWSIRDNNSTQTAWQTEVYFSSDPLWNHLRRGTIIVLWNRVVSSDGVTNHSADLNKDDGYIEVTVQNSTYFTGGDFYAGPTYLGPTLNFAAGGDIIQLRDASGTHVHCLAHKSTVGANFTALPNPKINLTAGIANGEATMICPGASLADYGTNSPQSGSVYASRSAVIDFGLPNVCSASSTANQDFWNDLREPDFISQVITPFPVVVGTPGSISFSWAACTDVYPTDVVTGYIILRNTTNTFTPPLDGTTYTDGQTLGGATILAHIPTSQITTYTDNTVMNGNEYYYRVYAYRYTTDQPNGNTYHVSRGRAYSDTYVSVETLLLPVSLANFDAYLENCTTILQWNTLNEINNDFFTIEKSHDGEHYEPFTEVDGSGVSLMPHQYSSIDEAPFQGINYYRLSQTDWNGWSEYLGVREIYNAVSTLQITLLGSDRYQLNGIQNAEVHVSVIDILGRLVDRLTAVATDGQAFFDVKQSTGYMLVIQDGNAQSVYRFSN